MRELRLGTCGIAQPNAMTQHVDHPPSSGELAPTSARRRAFRVGGRSRVSPDLLRVLPIVLPVALAGAVFATAAAENYVASSPSARTVLELLALVLPSVIAEAFPVPIEGVASGRTSLATIFIVGSSVIYGWAAATLVAVFTMALVEVARRKPLTRVVFNTAVYALAGGAAGGAAAATAGPGVGRTILATFAACSGFYVANITLLSTVVARWSRERLTLVFSRYVSSTAVPFGVMACLTVILVILWQRSVPAALVLAGPLASLVLYEHRMHAVLQRLRDLDRLKNEFIAVVSHELRTPLASVYGAAITLEQRALDEQSSESLLRVIYRESARLARLVDQVLWASRLESGRVDLLLGALDPGEVAAEVVDSARANLPPAISLDLALEDGPPPVIGDAERIKQILVNLVENAIKYSPDGGRIEVRLAPHDGHVRFTVTDEGLGIPATDQVQIFEKFHRLDPHLTRGVAGTGLGLYICRELLEGMNGRIWVTSDVGKGSAFTFELPRADTPF